MEIVDTHLHFWDLGRFRYPWLDDEGVSDLRSDYLPADWASDADGLDIVATVHVQAEMDHDVDPVRETSWLDTLADDGPGDRVPTVCVGYADLRDPALADVLDRHARYPLFRGIRQEAWFSPGAQHRADMPDTDLLADPAWARGLRLLASRGLLFELMVWPDQLPRAAELLRELPDLPVIVEHMGLPGSAGGHHLWRTNLTRFAREVPWSVVKLSGMRLCAESWTAGGARSLVQQTVETYGPSRCVFGSNYPVDRSLTSYRGLWSAFDDFTSDFTEAERRAMFHDNALRTYAITR
ncbi:amidohydrolase family protein [Actinomadura sp. B10D3]|uniref:amidohydrolase family protein n=1 Tax=Actinomadura sp. B10D3 TaxID=3153557 RepID=UPI00325F2162